MIAYFRKERWPGAEDMADEVFNRVIRRGRELFESYDGDPKNYFKTSARNLHLEYLRKYRPQPHVQSPEELYRRPADEEEKDRKERRDACLEKCMRCMAEENRKLAIAYHEKDKGDKIKHHKELAKSFGITINALRLRMFRIHATLRDCVTKCLQQ